MKRWTCLALMLPLACALAGQTSPPPDATEEAPADAPAQPARQVESKSPGTIVRDAQRAMAQEDYPQAEALLSEAMKLLPGEASLPYNLGVARFRQGDFEGAGNAFSRAAELANDPHLRARAAFNQGTSTYAQALKHIQQGGDAAPMQQPLEQSIDLVGNSLEQLKSAIEADPADRDARANAELAHKLLKQLEEIQQQMQQQQEQDQQQSSEQEQSEDEQQESSQQQDQNQQQSEGQPQESQQSEEQSQSQSEEQQQQQQEQQQSQTQQESEQEQEQEQAQQQQSQSDQQQAEEEQQQTQPQPGEEQELGEAEQQQSASEAEGEAGEREGQPREAQMTREQAERLLQMVRDKQRERRLAEAARRDRSRQPAVRDW